MTQFRISLTIEGVDPPHKRVRVNDFLRELQQLLCSLREVEEHIRPRAGGALYYQIVELNYGSPATIGIEPIPVNPAVDIRSEVISTFASFADCINRGQSLPEKVSPSLLASLGGMAAPVGKTLSRVILATPTNEISLTKNFRINTEQMLQPEETFPGFMRGMLEAINVHKGANLFRIYPDVGALTITCHFPADLQLDAIKAVGHFVEVHGIIKYKQSAKFPHEIQVTRLQAFPDEDELPTLRDLKGIAPNATGAKASEVFIRDLRNAAE